MNRIKFNHLLFLICCFPLLLIAGCSSLPDNINRSQSYAIENGSDTLLGQGFTRLLAAHEPDQSGGLLLSSGLDAFVARVVLASLAGRSIDIQYYMYHQDTVGLLLLDQLLKAADRGVRVRILIDDIYGDQADKTWSALDSHPGIEVRLFNPFVRGSSKSLQWLRRFKDVNYRMHSKSFTVDNQATIVGGRNIGNEYFDADPNLAFSDLDILAIGPVVSNVSASFDHYWNSDYAYPAGELVQPSSAGTIDDLKELITQASGMESAAIYIEALKNSKLAQALRTEDVSFKWGKAIVIHDSSQKKERSGDWQNELLISQLWPYVKKIENELIIVSPYFVPGPEGTEALCNLSQAGIKVRILTNSLASNDVFAVHAGYARYRKQLLKAGVVLYELDEQIKKAAEKHFTWLPGLSKSSLHAKTMVLDRKAMFVGSMNLDQRSLYINNEIGILFENAAMATRSAEAFDRYIGNVAFKLVLDQAEDGSTSIHWLLKKNGEEVVYDSEPYVGFWKKFGVFLVGLLPVESLL